MESSKLYVGNLTYSVNEEQLKELFAPYGTVNDVRVIEPEPFAFNDSDVVYRPVRGK